MSQSPSWYEIVSGNELRQGDLIVGCPALLLPENFLLSVNEPLQAVSVVPELWNVVVLTQSCDLANQKISRVLVCPYRPLSVAHELIPEDKRSKEKNRQAFFEQVRRGIQPNLHMLAASQEPEHEQEIQILDFREVFTVPGELLRQLAVHNGTRLRLIPPYREHLAQAFARFFMRVGLPADIPRFG